MNYFWLISFLGISTGVLLSPALLISFSMVGIAIFLLWKHLSVRIYLLCVVLGLIISLPGNVPQRSEIVGFCTLKKSSYTVVSNVRFFENGKWNYLHHDVKVKSDQINPGEEVYIYGKISKSFSYPLYTVVPDLSCGVRQTARGFLKVMSILQKFKEENEIFIIDVLGPFAKTVNGLLFSDGEFDQAEYSDLKSSGLAHIFAVSGLHVGIVYALVEIIVSFFTYKLFFRRFIGAFIALMFALSTGPTPSAFRAAVMLCIWSFFKIADYPVEPLNVLGMAGTFNILLEPYCILSTSFLMSYMATASILICQEKIRSYHIVVKTIFTPFSAFFGVAPFLNIFSSLNVLSPFLSIFATYLVIPIIWAAFISIFFRTIHMETLAQILLKGATPFVYLVQRLIHLSSLVPNFSLGLTGYILFSLLILFLFWHFGHKP